MPAKPAARMNDQHICTQPHSSSGAPHVGGTIVAAGSALVFINQVAAAVQGDTCICPEPGNSITGGSNSVFFGNTPAARQLDRTAHTGGQIAQGSTNVFIGD